MTVNKNQNGSELVLSVIGRVDTTTAPELDNTIKGSLDGVTSLILDLSGLEYISSAGLRVLLSAHKIMSSRGGMTVKNVNDLVMEVFDVTGFADILTIE